jgi:hypothetical protein
MIHDDARKKDELACDVILEAVPILGLTRINAAALSA